MIILGHRGGRGEGWPAENSLEAFQRAIDEGAHGVELDLRLCGTGEAVHAHDASLARVTNGAAKRPVHAVPRAPLPIDARHAAYREPVGDVFAHAHMRI